MTCKQEIRTTVRFQRREKMNEFDKADVLRERANVSFEEARDALKACGGDLLDAYVYLEKLGHIKNNERKDTPDPVPVPKMSSYSPAAAPKPEGPSFWSWLGHTLGTLLKKSTENYLVISHEGVVKFRMSILLLAILFMIFHGFILVAFVVSLFCGVKYSFAGKDDLSGANRVMETAGNRASEWWGSYRYSDAEINDLCRKYDAKEK